MKIALSLRQKFTVLSMSATLLSLSPVTASGLPSMADSIGRYADGRRDATGAVQRLVDSARQRNVVAYLPNGDYLINASSGIQLHDGSRLVMERGTRLIASSQRSGNYAVIKVYGVKGASVTGGAIVGERHRHLGKSGEWGMGIDVRGSASVRIADIVISDCWGDGVYIGALKGVPSRDITLQGVSAIGNRRQGLSVTSGDRILVADSKFIGTSGTAPSAGIDLEPNNGERVSNVTIRNCESSNNAGFGIMTWNSASNVRIVGCSIHRNARGGIYLGGRVDNVEVSKNVISSNGNRAIYLGEEVTNHKIEGNTHSSVP